VSLSKKIREQGGPRLCGLNEDLQTRSSDKLDTLFAIARTPERRSPLLAVTTPPPLQSPPDDGSETGIELSPMAERPRVRRSASS